MSNNLNFDSNNLNRRKTLLIFGKHIFLAYLTWQRLGCRHPWFPARFSRCPWPPGHIQGGDVSAHAQVLVTDSVLLSSFYKQLWKVNFSFKTQSISCFNNVLGHSCPMWGQADSLLVSLFPQKRDTRQEWVLGLPCFAWAASDFDAGCMGASYDITKLIPICISPPPAFPI